MEHEEVTSFPPIPLESLAMKGERGVDLWKKFEPAGFSGDGLRKSVDSSLAGGSSWLSGPRKVASDKSSGVTRPPSGGPPANYGRSMSSRLALETDRPNRGSVVGRREAAGFMGKGRNGLPEVRLDLGAVHRARDGGVGMGSCEPDEMQARREKLAYFEKRCSRITDNVYLGSDQVARNRETLLESGITHVLNCVGFVCPEYFPNDFAYKTLWLQDTPGEDITSVLYDVFDYLEEVRERHGRCLVHCCQGVSRSTSLVIAYLMWRDRRTFEEVFRDVKKARGVANPNMGFACQLLQWQRRVLRLMPASSSPSPQLGNSAPTTSPPTQAPTPRRSPSETAMADGLAHDGGDSRGGPGEKKDGGFGNGTSPSGLQHAVSFSMGMFSPTTPTGVRIYRLGPHSQYDPLRLVPKPLGTISVDALDPRGAFLVHTPGVVFVWFGRACVEEMAVSGRRSAAQISRYERAGPVVEVIEGQEPMEFMNALRDVSCVSSPRNSTVDEPGGTARVSSGPVSHTGGDVEMHVEGEAETLPCRVSLPHGQSVSEVAAYNSDYELYFQAISGGIVLPPPGSPAAKALGLGNQPQMRAGASSRRPAPPPPSQLSLTPPSTMSTPPDDNGHPTAMRRDHASSGSPSSSDSLSPTSSTSASTTATNSPCPERSLSQQSFMEPTPTADTGQSEGHGGVYPGALTFRGNPPSAQLRVARQQMEGSKEQQGEAVDGSALGMFGEWDSLTSRREEAATLEVQEESSRPRMRRSMSMPVALTEMEDDSPQQASDEATCGSLGRKRERAGLETGRTRSPPRLYEWPSLTEVEMFDMDDLDSDSAFVLWVERSATDVALLPSPSSANGDASSTVFAPSIKAMDIEDSDETEAKVVVGDVFVWVGKGLEEGQVEDDTSSDEAEGERTADDVGGEACEGSDSGDEEWERRWEDVGRKFLERNGLQGGACIKVVKEGEESDLFWSHFING